MTLGGYAQSNSTSRFELESDPIAFALKGYSLHGIYVYQNLRTDLGIFGIEQPESYSGNEGFQIQSAGVGLKVNYLLNEAQTWFAGVGTGYSENNITFKESGEKHVHKLFGIGVHIGYRWFMFNKSESAFRNLYLTPWASIDYNKPLNSVSFAQQNYTQQTWSVFPTVHIGYKF
jgi:hypothetical protein